MKFKTRYCLFLDVDEISLLNTCIRFTINKSNISKDFEKELFSLLEKLKSRKEV